MAASPVTINKKPLYPRGESYLKEHNKIYGIDLQKKNLKNCLEYPYKSSVLSD
jgi:hypothetical protein